jgi:hypothetical protein
MAAPVAFASGIVFEKFYSTPTFGTFFVKNGAWTPVSAVLSRTFHDF